VPRDIDAREENSSWAKSFIAKNVTGGNIVTLLMERHKGGSQYGGNLPSIPTKVGRRDKG